MLPLTFTFYKQTRCLLPYPLAELLPFPFSRHITFTLQPGSYFLQKKMKSLLRDDLVGQQYECLSMLVICHRSKPIQ